MQHYSEKTFCIDLICDFYNTTSPIVIIAKAKEVLDIDLSLSDIRDYLNYEEDWKKESNYVRMSEIFN